MVAPAFSRFICSCKRVCYRAVYSTLIAALSIGLVSAHDGLFDLGELEQHGGANATGVSSNGNVVVGNAGINYPGYAARAFRWTAEGGMRNLGLLDGGRVSLATGVSADGSVVVGWADDFASGGYARAFRWTESGGMKSLGVLNGGLTSFATAASRDGSVVVGYAADGSNGNADRAVRWTQLGGIQSLGVLNGGQSSSATAVSANGSVVVGFANDGAAGNLLRAFRWSNSNGMQGLGTLESGNFSWATGVSADGSVVVGGGDTVVNTIYTSRAFRWTSAGGMQDLGVLPGGRMSEAKGISGNGAVIVGNATDAAHDSMRGFRWTRAGGMQTVEDWLRANGVTVTNDVTSSATSTNRDGSVVVGGLQDGHSYIARVSPLGNGLTTIDHLFNSLKASGLGIGQALRSINVVTNGAHSRPLDRRVGEGQKTIWVAGDWGRDDHGNRNGPFGLSEVGGGNNLGLVQLNLSLGQTWAKQNLLFDGQARNDGTYLMAEALVPLHTEAALWATFSMQYHWGQADIRRGYIDTGAQDFSRGKADTNTWSIRTRIDWDNAFHAGKLSITPFADLGYTRSHLDSYTETGGGFPAQFDARHEKATESRLGINASYPIASGRLSAVGALESAHRFEAHGARTSGEIIGLFPFDLEGQANKRDWLRAGLGIKGKVGSGELTVMLNATTQGEMPSAWLSGAYQVAF